MKALNDAESFLINRKDELEDVEESEGYWAHEEDQKISAVCQRFLFKLGKQNPINKIFQKLSIVTDKNFRIIIKFSKHEIHKLSSIIWWRRRKKKSSTEIFKDLKAVTKSFAFF